MAIQVTARDARSSVIVNPGWYIVEVESMSTKAANTDGSTNYNYKLRILSDLKGSEEYADVPVKNFLINEKGLFGSGVAFFAACDTSLAAAVDAMKKDKNAPSIPLDENAPVGKKMRAFIKNTTWEGRTSNEATDFLPL